MILNERPDINIWGFYQPGHTYEGDRFGYDLAVIEKDEIKTYPFARINDKQFNGKLGYTFDDTAFDKVVKSLESFEVDDRPIVLVFDELGWLEFDHNGHYPSICKALRQIPSNRHVAIIFALNHSLYSRAKDLVSGLNGKISENELHCPALDDAFERFLRAVFESAQKLYV